jgi:ABC-2 type transport system permease protein
MQNILAIWQRELKSYFVSPIAYVVLTIFLLLFGIFFFIYFAWGTEVSMMSQMGQGSQPHDVPAKIAQLVFGVMRTILLFVVPMLTMGLFSEEKKRGTIELLLTTPVGHLSAIIGKYLASLTILIILFAASCITFSVLFFSQPDWKPILAGYFGMLLYGAALLALGLFISTLTENQIIAVFLTFGVSLVFLLVNSFSSLFVSGTVREVINYLSIIDHLEDFTIGVINTSHIIYYVTFAFVGLFLAYRSLESMRWKG